HPDPAECLVVERRLDKVQAHFPDSRRMGEVTHQHPKNRPRTRRSTPFRGKTVPPRGNQTQKRALQRRPSADFSRQIEQLLRRFHEPPPEHAYHLLIRTRSSALRTPA